MRHVQKASSDVVTRVYRLRSNVMEYWIVQITVSSILFF